MADQPTNKKVMGTFEALGFVWDVLFAIAVPTILFALGGRWLDQRWNSGPLFTVVGLALALAVAGALIMRKAKRLKEDLQ